MAMHAGMEDYMSEIGPIAIVVLGVVVVALLVVLTAQRRSQGQTDGANQLPLDSQAVVQSLLGSIQELQRKIEDSRLDAVKHQTSLVGEIEKVMIVNSQLLTQGQDLRTQTTRLSEALTSSSTSGDWGELQLERTVELANMTEHVSWVAKEQISANGKKLIPDLIVHLPNSRKVVVDAKAPKVDFDGTGDEVGEALVEALRGHVNDLADRDYSTWVADAVDFVVLFVPTEGILASALRYEPKLAEEAIRRRVLLATPMTLLALLRAVEYGWKQIEQSRNAMVIAEQSKELVNSLTAFITKFNVVAGGLTTAINNYNIAASYLENTVNRQARRVTELGVQSNDLKDVTQLSLDAPRQVTWNS